MQVSSEWISKRGKSESSGSIRGAVLGTIGI